MAMKSMSLDELNKLIEKAFGNFERTQPVGTAWSPGNNYTEMPSLEASIPLTNSVPLVPPPQVYLPKPQPKTDEEWEVLSRTYNNAPEVAALLRLLDIERAAVEVLRNELTIATKKPVIIDQQKQNDWIAHTNNPTAPLIPYEE